MVSVDQSDATTTRRERRPPLWWAFAAFVGGCTATSVVLLLAESPDVRLACWVLLGCAAIVWGLVALAALVDLHPSLRHPSSSRWLAVPPLAVTIVAVLLTFGIPLRLEFAFAQDEFESAVREFDAHPDRGSWDADREIGTFDVIEIERFGDATYFTTDPDAGSFGGFSERGIVHSPNGVPRGEDARLQTTYELLWGDWWSFVWSD